MTIVIYFSLENDPNNQTMPTDDLLWKVLPSVSFSLLFILWKQHILIELKQEKDLAQSALLP